MGGLHMFYASAGHCDLETIIPLSAKNFLIVTGSQGPGCDTHGPQAVSAEFLAKTIVATDPSVATPVSTVEQKKIIQLEGLYYAKHLE